MVDLDPVDAYCIFSEYDFEALRARYGDSFSRATIRSKSADGRKVSGVGPSPFDRHANKRTAKRRRVRVGPARDALMGIIRRKLHDCFDSADVPPLLQARDEWLGFVDALKGFRPRVCSEIDAPMAEWRKLMEAMNMADALDQLIAVKVDALLNGMRDDSLQLLLDLTDRLKATDDAWRGRTRNYRHRCRRRSELSTG
jgi:hypothetical protein